MAEDKYKSQAIHPSETRLRDSLLYVAVKQRDIPTALQLVQEGAVYTLQDDRGQTPLHIALENNLMCVVDKMMSYYLYNRANPIDCNGLSYFHIACTCSGDIGINSIKHFINIGENLNKVTNHDSEYWPGFSTLHFAVAFGRLNNVSLLLSYGATYSLKDKLNHTAFDIALAVVQASRAEIFIYIMREILSCHLIHKDSEFNDFGFTRLHLLRKDDCATKIRGLVSNHKIDINKKIIKPGSNFHHFTPLHFAVELENNSELIEILIKLGADMFARDSRGYTPLHLSLDPVGPAMSSFRGPMGLGASPSVLENFVAPDGLSLFDIAVIFGNIELAKNLVCSGADVDSRMDGDDKGSTPLHLAIIYDDNDSNYEIVKFLIENGASVLSVTEGGNTPLHLAINPGMKATKIANLLIENGASVSAVNDEGKTPFDFAMGYHDHS
ncbi:hypothetical protein QAD02_003724 [Eretmocerus hayati]|uniref:Uncharacterized protein n=1 Tax=Eretmocerus hayati TaxID=131215 RepID=A0ACC2NSE0_9HYME|nr:hypothetical protein QAD02_003724 [Eretmocerus hayati]